MHDEDETRSSQVLFPGLRGPWSYFAACQALSVVHRSKVADGSASGVGTIAMAKAPYLVIKIPADTAGLPESLGTKEKFWVQLDGAYHLIKFGRAGTGEDWAEKVVCELSTLLEIPHAHYDLATCSSRSCVISPSFVPEDGRLIHGNELISMTGKPYDGARIYKQREHTVSRVVAALYVATRPNHVATFNTLLGYLMLDAWVGNTDRHHENWGLVRRSDGHVELAPTYDHASSLGRELTDDERTGRLITRDERYSVRSFASKARSALYANSSDKKSLGTLNAFTEVAKLNPKAAQAWLVKLAELDDELISDVFDCFPPGIITNPAREFAIKMLEANRSVLLTMRRQ